MPADVTKDTSSYGRFRGIIDLSSQNASANTSTFRVRGILYNDGPIRAFNNNNILFSITGAHSWSESKGFSVNAKSNSTVIDRSFTLSHDANGNRANVSVTVNVGNTSTSTFGDPPAITVDRTPPRIPKVPKAGTNLTNTITIPNKINFSWGAPDNMGSAILEYQLQYDDQSNFSSPATVSTGTSRSRTITVGIGKTWYGRFRTRNAVGWSGWSNVSSRSVPNVPNTPGRPTVVFTAPNKLTASWSAPGNNGATITKYTVEYTTDSTFATGVISVNAGTSTSIALTNLSINKTYYIRVYATNSQGNSGKSSAGSYIIPNVPGAPGAPTLVISPPTSLTVTWTAPASNGGASVTSYLIEYSTSSSFSSVSSTTSTTLSTTLTGLNPGSTYYIRVYARNSQGSSGASGSSSQLMYAGPRINVSGTYKNSVAYVNVGGVWKVAVPYVNVSGVWKIAGG